jgi:hypothetical protein
MPPMNVRGSGAWPENSAPEKSNPGFYKINEKGKKKSEKIIKRYYNYYYY